MIDSCLLSTQHQLGDVQYYVTILTLLQNEKNTIGMKFKVCVFAKILDIEWCENTEYQGEAKSL